MIHMQFWPNDLSFGSLEVILGQIRFLPLTLSNFVMSFKELIHEIGIMKFQRLWHRQCLMYHYITLECNSFGKARKSERNSSEWVHLPNYYNHHHLTGAAYVQVSVEPPSTAAVRVWSIVSDRPTKTGACKSVGQGPLFGGGGRLRYYTLLFSRDYFDYIDAITFIQFIAFFQILLLSSV